MLDDIFNLLSSEWIVILGIVLAFLYVCVLVRERMQNDNMTLLEIFRGIDERILLGILACILYIVGYQLIHEVHNQILNWIGFVAFLLPNVIVIRVLRLTGALRDNIRVSISLFRAAFLGATGLFAIGNDPSIGTVGVIVAIVAGLWVVIIIAADFIRG